MNSSTLTWMMASSIAMLACFAVYTMVTLPYEMRAAKADAVTHEADDDSIVLANVLHTNIVPITVADHASAIANIRMSDMTYRQWLMGQALAGACNHLEYDVCVDEAVSKVHLLLRKLAYEKMRGQP